MSSTRRAPLSRATGNNQTIRTTPHAFGHCQDMSHDAHMKSALHDRSTSNHAPAIHVPTLCKIGAAPGQREPKFTATIGRIMNQHWSQTTREARPIVLLVARPSDQIDSRCSNRFPFAVCCEHAVYHFPDCFL